MVIRIINGYLSEKFEKKYNDLILCKMKKSAKKSTIFSSFSIVLYYNFLTRWDNIVPISIKVIDNMHNNNVWLKKS